LPIDSSSSIIVRRIDDDVVSPWNEVESVHEDDMRRPGCDAHLQKTQKSTAKSLYKVVKLK